MTGITDKWDEPPAPIDAEKPTHERFTVAGTAYMRNVSREDMNGKWFAIHHQDAPRPGSKPGTTTISLRFPVLLVAHYVEGREALAKKVARILNAHWDDEG
jgi:hypothetical protein